MWNNVDKMLKKYYEQYLNEYKYLKDNIQLRFASLKFNYNQLYEYATQKEIDKFKRCLKKEKTSMDKNSYIYYLTERFINMKKIKNIDIFKYYIYLEYYHMMKNNSINENQLFKNVIEEAHKQVINELKPKKRVLDIINLTLLSLNKFVNNLGYEWQNYIEEITKYNSEELVRQAIINMNSNNELNVDDIEFEKIFVKQQKRMLNINDGKISGAIENQTDNVFNYSKLEIGKQYGAKECRFISEIDSRTTEMCQTLNNQIFKLNEMNVYSRYSEKDNRSVIYHTKGLVVGENLPPINNHFHYCRSTITYLTELSHNELIAEYNQLKSIIPSEVPKTLEEYSKLRYNNDYYEEIKLKEEIGKHYKKDLEIGEKKKTLSFNEYYKKVNDTREYLKNVQAKNFGVIGEVTFHTIDRMIDRNITKEDIKEILQEPTNQWYNPINDSQVFFKNKKMVALDREELSIKTVYKGRGKKNE